MYACSAAEASAAAAATAEALRTYNGGVIGRVVKGAAPGAGLSSGEHLAPPLERVMLAPQLEVPAMDSLTLLRFARVLLLGGAVAEEAAPMVCAAQTPSSRFLPRWEVGANA